MDFHQAGGGGRAALDPAAVDPFLYCDMGLRLKLETALFRLGAVVALQRSLDIDGMGVVSLDQVAIVAVHRADQRPKRRAYTWWQAAGEACGSRGQFNGEVGQPRAVH